MTTPQPDRDYVRALFDALVAACTACDGEGAVGLIRLIGRQIGQERMYRLLDELVAIGLRRAAATLDEQLMDFLRGSR
ncbi:hypothetical protein ACPPVO_52005 [Dactylosporangium sp. McL0621]|uniref:hypothetical protein n=1 Tax=Dactylosporangium sp. McL0621 TaxID=3415678 RepID=UPI003CF11F9A